MSQGGNAPIIIRRRKVTTGGGHHGGAWKVAYADFVTAMMAFFMLMWLLNATTEQQRKGIADYFAPSVPVSRTSGGSDGIFGGDSPTSREPMERAGAPGGPSLPPPAQTAGTAEAAEAETALLREIEEMLLARGGESLLSDEALAHVVTRLTDEGLVIEAFALPGRPLFAPGTDQPEPVLVEVAGAVARVAGLAVNPMAFGAHLPALPVVLRDTPAWSLSADRAQAARRLVEAAGYDPRQVHRVTGHGDRAPVAANPLSERNEWVTFTLLRLDRAGPAGPAR